MPPKTCAFWFSIDFAALREHFTATIDLEMKTCSCVYQLFPLAGGEFGILCRIDERIHFAKSHAGRKWVQRSGNIEYSLPATGCVGHLENLSGREYLCEEFRFDGILRFHDLDGGPFLDLRVATDEVGRVDGISSVEGHMYWGTVGGEIVSLNENGVPHTISVPEPSGLRLVGMVDGGMALLIHPPSARLCLHFMEEQRTEALPSLPISAEDTSCWPNSGWVKIHKCGRFLAIQPNGRGLWLLECSPMGKFKFHGPFGTNVSRSNFPGWVKAAAYDNVSNRLYMVGAKARIPDVSWHKPKNVHWVAWVDLNGPEPIEYMPEDEDNSKGFGRERPQGFLLPHAPLVMGATGRLYDFNGRLVTPSLEIETK